MATWFDPTTLDCSGATPEQVAEAAAYASSMLYQLTGRRWPGEVADVLYRGDANPLCLCPPAVARNAASAGCVCPCGSSALWQLPGYPVLEVTQVLGPDSVAIATGWRVDDRRLLVRTNGDGWADGTKVTYLWGGAPPEGVAVAKRYACEVAKLWSCQPCKISATAQTVTRQGVTVTREAAAAVAAAGGTGYRPADLWVAAVLRGDRIRAGAVYAPEDWPAQVRRTG